MNHIFGKHILGRQAMKFNKIRLLQHHDDAFFLDGIKELYQTIEKDTNIEVERKIVPHRRIKSYLIRKLITMPFLFKFRNHLAARKHINFTAMISGDFSVLLTDGLFSKLNFVYMHDAWPRFHYWIFPILELFNVKQVFFSSKQVWLDHLRKYPNSKCQSMWLPEGINADEYRFKPFDQKSIDVLEFGRRHEAYHLLIKDELSSHGKYHFYQQQLSGLLFPDKSALVAALANAKIVICVPSDITHPERAEYISTMTLRYLQAMASKCLIVGVTPSDMHELFNYQPIVEIDMENAAAQLLTILKNYRSFQPLIERNYKEVHNHHQWLNRWAIIKQNIEAIA